MMFRVGGVDPERALAAIGEFKAIDRLMSEAAGKGYGSLERVRSFVRKKIRQNGAPTLRKSVTRKGAQWMRQMRFSSATAKLKGGAKCRSTSFYE